MPYNILYINIYIQPVSRYTTSTINIYKRNQLQSSESRLAASSDFQATQCDTRRHDATRRSLQHLNFHKLNVREREKERERSKEIDKETGNWPLASAKSQCETETSFLHVDRSQKSWLGGSRGWGRSCGAWHWTPVATRYVHQMQQNY